MLLLFDQLQYSRHIFTRPNNNCFLIEVLCMVLQMFACLLELLVGIINYYYAMLSWKSCICFLEKS